MFDLFVQFVEDESYRQQCWQSCPEDRPLIVQFCANDRQVLLAAAKLVEDKCDGALNDCRFVTHLKPIYRSQPLTSIWAVL